MQLPSVKACFLVTVSLLGVMGPVNAQALRNANGPAETPPSSFRSNQYVDSRGCVFVRAGIGGNTNWVPRVTRSRQQLCGFEPSATGGALAGIQEDLPELPPLPPRPDAGGAEPTAPRATVAAATAPAARPAAPVAAAPVAAPRPAAAPSPQVITMPAAAPQPQRVTRAEVCAGRTGVQPGFVSARTGAPIDCGGTQAVASVRPAPVTRPSVTQPAAEPVATRSSRDRACADMAATGRRYVSSVTGLPLQCDAPVTVAAAAPRGYVRPYRNPLDMPAGTVQVGAAAQPSSPYGAPYSNPPVNGAGQVVFASPEGPIVVPAQRSIPVGAARPTAAATRPAAAVTRPGPVVTAQATAPAPRATGYRNVLDAPPGSVVFASPNGPLAVPGRSHMATTGVAQRPGGQAPANPVNVTRSAASPSSGGFFANLFSTNPPPYSNPPAYAVAQDPRPPSGYQNVWDDGRLNVNRGEPRASGTVQYATAPAPQTAAQPAQQARPQTQARVSTRTVPQVVQPRAERITGHRYVQVGTYGSRDQAQSAARALRAQGLPMRVGVYSDQGREMRIVLAGPFGSDQQLQSALRAARQAGHSGAFTRR